MSQTREAVDRFVAALSVLPELMGLADRAALAPRLEHLLKAVRDGELPDRGVIHGAIAYQQHGIGFILSWTGCLVDVDVDRAYVADGPRRLVIDPWKVASCGARLGLATDVSAADEYLREIAQRGLCDWTDDQYVWPPATETPIPL